MEAPRRGSESPTSLSSPPSAISEPTSPTRFLNQGRANIEMDEIVVDPGSAARFGVLPGQHIPPPPPAVPLTAAGLPRKKPGRKPGTTIKPKVAPDGTPEVKKRRPRKPRDPDAPPIQRKRKAATTEPGDASTDPEPRPFPGATASASRQPKITESTSTPMDLDPRPAPPTSVTASTGTQQQTYGLKMPKRESLPGSMMSILNDDEPPQRPRPSSIAPPAPPPPPTRQIFDPVRGNYDPVRETMITRDPYGTGGLGSPRAPTSSAHVVNRASASPSIASLVDPPPTAAHHIVSPVPSQQSYSNNNGSATIPSRFHESTSMPPSPSTHVRSGQQQPLSKPTKPTFAEVKRQPPPPAAPTKPAEPPTNTFTSMSSVPLSAGVLTAPVQSKKVAAVAKKDSEKHKGSTSSSSPHITSLKDALPSIPSASRSILDFGKANPGEERQAPSIVLHIPLNGESNKVVNFMRMAEERYGWDALHPRLAAHRDRKARIAAASAALAQTGSGRESGDEMSVDLQSDAEGSGGEMEGVVNGATGGLTSGPDGAPAKPLRKKRINKEDEYDKDDDFVDDSELLWEEQAAASRDGFFVYSGPLIPEVEKPPAGEAPARRGRGGGRGSRGGRGGARGEGTGRGRGGGPGSRGGAVTRKPRITKLEKEQRDREKAEREKLAQLASKSVSATSPYNLLQVGQSSATGVAG